MVRFENFGRFLEKTRRTPEAKKSRLIIMKENKTNQEQRVQGGGEEKGHFESLLLSK